MRRTVLKRWARLAFLAAFGFYQGNEKREEDYEQ